MFTYHKVSSPKHEKKNLCSRRSAKVWHIWMLCHGMHYLAVLLNSMPLISEEWNSRIAPWGHKICVKMIIKYMLNFNVKITFAEIAARDHSQDRSYQPWLHTFWRQDAFGTTTIQCERKRSRDWCYGDRHWCLWICDELDGLAPIR